MERDDIFKQAIVRAQEKDYKAARSLLRNLLFKYPEDINALLLFSLKHAPPSKALAHIAPQIPRPAAPLRRKVNPQGTLVEREADNIYSAIDNIRNTTRSSAPMLKAAPNSGKNPINPILLFFLVLIFLCVLVAGIEAALILLKI